MLLALSHGAASTSEATPTLEPCVILNDPVACLTTSCNMAYGSKLVRRSRLEAAPHPRGRVLARAGAGSDRDRDLATGDRGVLDPRPAT